MNDQTIASPSKSRFSGALLRVRPHSKWLSAFLLQSAVIWVAGIFSSIMGVSYSGFSVFEILTPQLSARGIIENEIFLAMVWLCIWLVTKINSKYIGLLVPSSLSPKEGEADYEEEISIIKEAFNKEVSYTDKEAALSNKLRVIQAIDSRVARLRGRTTIMLLTTGALLVCASLIIVFAGSLTNLDVAAGSNVDKLATSILDVEAHIARLSEISQAAQNLNNDNISPEARTLLQKKISDIRGFDRTLPTDSTGIQAVLAEDRSRLTTLEDLYHTAWVNELTSPHGYSDTRYIVATAIIRIGVVLVIIFLAQILIGLYRYNTRLITFYHSRRDLVQIWDGKTTNVDKLQKLMAPNVDFGKEPKHPLDEIIRQVIAKIPAGGGSLVESGKQERAS